MTANPLLLIAVYAIGFFSACGMFAAAYLAGRIYRETRGNVELRGTSTKQQGTSECLY